VGSGKKYPEFKTAVDAIDAISCFQKKMLQRREIPTLQTKRALKRLRAELLVNQLSKIQSTGLPQEMPRLRSRVPRSHPAASNFSRASFAACLAISDSSAERRFRLSSYSEQLGFDMHRNNATSMELGLTAGPLARADALLAPVGSLRGSLRTPAHCHLPRGIPNCRRVGRRAGMRPPFAASS
jgi:hypothetical protein